MPIPNLLILSQLIKCGPCSFSSNTIESGYNIEFQMPFFYHSKPRLCPTPHSLVVKLENIPSQQLFLSASSPPPKQESKETNEGRWDEAENLKFTVFMAYYQHIFASRHQRKNSKIFKSLASYLGERTAPQCRSHFQKLLVKHKTAAKIKKHYRSLFGEQVFDGEYEQFRSDWEQNHQPIRRTSLCLKEFREVATQTEGTVPNKEEQPSLNNTVKAEHPSASPYVSYQSQAQY